MNRAVAIVATSATVAVVESLIQTAAVLTRPKKQKSRSTKRKARARIKKRGF